MRLIRRNNRMRLMQWLGISLLIASACSTQFVATSTTAWGASGSAPAKPASTKAMPASPGASKLTSTKASATTSKPSSARSAAEKTATSRAALKSSSGKPSSTASNASTAPDSLIFRDLADDRTAKWVALTGGQRNFYVDAAHLPKAGQSGAAFIRIKETNLPDRTGKANSLYYVARMGVDCSHPKISSPSHVLFYNTTGKLVNPMGPLQMNWSPLSGSPAGKPLWNMVCKRSQ